MDHRDVEQAKALINDAQGYLDKVAREAQDVANRAAGMEAKAQEYDMLVQQIVEARAELASVQADVKRAEQAFAAFKDVASKR